MTRGFDRRHRSFLAEQRQALDVLDELEREERFAQPVGHIDHGGHVGRQAVQTAGQRLDRGGVGHARELFCNRVADAGHRAAERFVGAFQVFERLGQRGDESARGQRSRLDQLEQFLGGYPEALGGERGSARQRVAELLAQFFETHRALGRHLPDRFERLFRLRAAEAKQARDAGQLAEQGVRVPERDVRGMGGRGELGESRAQIEHFQARRVGRSLQRFNLRCGRARAAVDGLEPELQRLHAADGFVEGARGAPHDLLQ